MVFFGEVKLYVWWPPGPGLKQSVEAVAWTSRWSGLTMSKQRVIFFYFANWHAIWNQRLGSLYCGCVWIVTYEYFYKMSQMGKNI